MHEQRALKANPTVLGTYLPTILPVGQSKGTWYNADLAIVKSKYLVPRTEYCELRGIYVINYQ